MTLTEKVAYLKGLAEGLALDESKPEIKVIKAMMDILDDLALTVSDLEDGMDLISEQLDAVEGYKEYIHHETQPETAEEPVAE